MSGLRFARGSAKGGELMQDCCLTCKNLEYKKNYVKDILGGGTNEQANECG